MLFILALAIGVVLAAVGHRIALNERLGSLARGAAAVAGFIIGFAGTYIVVANIH